MASWSDGRWPAEWRSIFNVDRPIGTRYGDRGVRLAQPTAVADSPVRDGAPYFASQHGRALALRDRLNRDRVAHTGDE